VIVTAAKIKKILYVHVKLIRKNAAVVCIKD